MGKKLAILLVALSAVSAISSGFVAMGMRAYSNYQQNSLASQEHCGGQSPVHICVVTPLDVFSAYYPYYLATHTPQFFVKYSSSSPQALILSLSVVGFSQAEAHTVNATSATQTQGFIPVPLNSAIRKLTTDAQTTVSVRVTDTRGRLYYFNDSPLLLHSHKLMQWVGANRLKIAAWVTPDDPAVKSLVAKAVAMLPNEPAPAPAAMIGYADHADARAVRDQVDAIFDALRVDYHMRYLQQVVSYGGPGDTSVSLQNINLPAESLQQGSGMCIELTVLMASAVEQIGLHAEIVITSYGHAYLGVAATPDNSSFEYWDPSEVNANVAGDSANVATDQTYTHDAASHQIIDTIVISAARAASIVPMV